jgi:Family of unknown function (DUF6535)
MTRLCLELKSSPKAGLFSAVLTAFIIDSYKMLQPDSQKTTATLLLHLMQQLDTLLRTNNTAIDTLSANSLSSLLTPFQPPPCVWWINAIWFSSLMCSLSAAFFAMLTKQWLQAYTLDRPGRVETHARQRHFRYAGLVTWKVSVIISTLPVLLQAGFSLFFVGLDILLWSINPDIGYIMISLTVLLLGFYVITTIAPLFDLTCPFKTPFSLFLRLRVRWVYCQGPALTEYARALFSAIRFRTPRPSFQLNHAPSNSEMERAGIDEACHLLNVGVIEWLVATSHSLEVVDVALRATSSLRPDFSATSMLRDSGAIHLLVDRLEPPLIEDPSSASVAFRRHAANSIPYLASMFCALRHCTQSEIAPILSRFHWRAWIVSWGDFTLDQLVHEGWDLDALALYLCASTQCDRAEGRRANREFGVMVELLNRHSFGKAHLQSFSVWALVDTIALWGAEFGEPSMASTRPAVAACLLRLLGLPYTMGDPVTCAVGLALGVFVLDFQKQEVSHYRDEETRRQDAQTLLIRGVVDIMKDNPHDTASRYCLGGTDFEAGGLVICKLLIENNVPSWPSGASTALIAVLSFSKSESLTCRVLETFRRLLSFDSQSTVPKLSSTIIPLLEKPATEPVQINATQVLGEMMHWREHRKAILGQRGVRALIRNLNSSCGDLSNASSLALVGLARDSDAQDRMVDLGLAEGLTTYFASSNATQQNLAYWSWTFVGSTWIERHHVDGGDFKQTFRELTRVLEHSMHTGDSMHDASMTPVRRRDLQRILQSLKRISDKWESDTAEE